MNLATKYAEATEWNLATLGELCSLKSSSQSRINRQTSICRKMLQVCQEYESEIQYGTNPSDARTLFARTAPRVYELLKKAKLEPEGLEGALYRWRRDLVG